MGSVEGKGGKKGGNRAKSTGDTDSNFPSSPLGSNIDVTR